MTLRRILRAFLAKFTIVVCSAILPAPAQSASTTQVVLIGTGNPGPAPDRSGPCTAIMVNGTPYLIDLGPGVVRRANAAVQKGVTRFGGREPENSFHHALTLRPYGRLSGFHL